MSRVLVIGASGGIGRACVKLMAAQSWEVIAADLAKPESDPPAVCETLDVTDADTVAKFAEAHPSVDAVIYAAGTVASMSMERTDFSVWRRIMAVNLDGAAHVAKPFTAQMIERGTGGAFVFLSSAAGLRGESGATAYSASKAGLIGMVEAMAAELTPHNIRVNAVAPGNVDTPMLRKVAADIALNTGETETEVWDGFARTGAAQRLIAPREVAEVCAALCSPPFSGVTGATVPVDAGYLLT